MQAMAIWIDVPVGLVAATVGETSGEWPSLGTLLLYFLGMGFLLLLNAFFVASEFAIVKVRPSQLEAIEKESPGRTRTAAKVVGELDRYLAANQLGITVSSLALGFLGASFVFELTGPGMHALGVPAMEGLRGFPVSPVSVLAFLLAVGVFTFLHVVFGQAIPKSVAVRLPVETALRMAAPLAAFHRTFGWAARFLNDTANFLLRRCFHLEPISGNGNVLSSEELAVLVAQSGEAKVVTDMEREIAVNALELNELWVRDVMTPRQDVVVLDADQPFGEVLEVAKKSKHTRFPLVKGGHLDNHIGLIHIKDILKLIGGAGDPDLMRIKRELKLVPDTMPLDSLLKFFLQERAHLALVVDEFGTPVGLVFLDNVIEEIVGDIQDEFDNERPEFVRVNDHEFVVDGTLTLNDLSDIEQSLALESGEVTTVGGYVTQQLGRFPEVGELVEIFGWEAKVTSTDGRRVGQVHFRRLDPAA
jgi:CBS domain containing-hemolysin-like protein